MMADAEIRRVEKILARDRAERAREKARQEAQFRVESGDIASSADTMLEPTPEWLEQGETMPFTGKQDDGSVRVVRTVRRVQNSYVRRLHRSCRVSDDQYAACIWYRDTQEVAGLQGRYKTASIDRPAGGGEPDFGYMAKTTVELDARRDFRAAREAVGEPIKFFEKVVLDDMPLVKASNYAQFGQKRAIQRFCAMLDRLVVYLESRDLDLSGINLSRDG